MKRLFHILSLVVALVTLLPIDLSAQTQDNALYVYRNDGDFTAFLREDLDSIVLSHYDADSVYQKECVTQVFYTPDSIYRIPIAAIDSVSLVQPEIIYNPTVVRIDEWIPYLSEIDTTRLALTFSSNLPYQATSGDILLYPTCDDDRLPSGFAGRVVAVNSGDNITIVCDSVNFDDLFEQYVVVTKIVTKDEDEAKQTRPSKVKSDIEVINDFKTIIQPIDLTVNLSKKEYDGKYKDEIQGEGDVNVTVNGSLNASLGIYMVITKFPGRSSDIKCTVSHGVGIDLAIKSELSGSLKYIPKHLRKAIVPRVPIPYTGGFFYLAVDLISVAEVEGSASAGWTLEANAASSMEIVRKDGKVSFGKPANTSSAKIDYEIDMEGSAFIGLRLNPAIKSVAELIEMGVNFDLGPKVEGKLSMSASSLMDGAYETLKDDSLETSLGAYISAEASVGRLSRESDVLSFALPLDTLYLLPEFTMPQYSKGASSSTAVITTNPSRNLFLPVGLGIGIENESGEKVATQWSSVEYQKEEEWQTNGLSESFSGVTSGNKYKAYPYVRIMGKELKASPACEFEAGKEDGNSDDNVKPADRPYPEGICPDDNHPHMIDLGLPSGTKWACCNVGATNPGGVGGYYAWGETAEKDKYIKSTHKYYSSLYELVSLSKILNDNSVLPYQKDAAYVNWGSQWRTPTKDQIDELFNAKYISSHWTGYGVEFKNTETGATLFLPLTGFFQDEKIVSSQVRGYYWTISPYVDYDGDLGYPYVLDFVCGSGGYGGNSADYGAGIERYSRIEYGLPVRAVAR